MTTALDAPVSPATIGPLVEVVNDPNSTLARVAEVVSTDTGLTARVLRLANSAQFGLSRRVTDISMATGLAGGNMVLSIAIAGSCKLLDRDALPGAREHALFGACAARTLAVRAGLSKSDAFAAGLLHDIGEILLWQQDPDTYRAKWGTWESTEDQLRWERGHFGTDHALVAREQLSEWQLPGLVVDAVGDHHRPDLGHVDLSTLIVASEELVDGVGLAEDDDRPTRLHLFGVTDADREALVAEVRDHADNLAGILAPG